MNNSICRKCTHRHVCRDYAPFGDRKSCRWYKEILKSRRAEASDDFESILICAERYACGRQNYMPHIVVDYITPLIPDLSIKALTVIRNDITAMAEHDSLGDKRIDAPMWKELRSRIIDELRNREAQNETK